MNVAARKHKKVSKFVKNKIYHRENKGLQTLNEIGKLMEKYDEVSIIHLLSLKGWPGRPNFTLIYA